MKTLSSALQTEVDSQYGLEPIYKLVLNWETDGEVHYSTKNVEVSPIGTTTLSKIDSLNYSRKSKSVGSINIINVSIQSLPDDVNRFHTQSIKGRVAKIYMNASGGTNSDWSLIYEGDVEDIKWLENSGIIDISIISKIREDEKILFQPNLGEVPIDDEDVLVDGYENQIWPKAFGNVVHEKALRITEIKTSRLTSPIKISLDPTPTDETDQDGNVIASETFLNIYKKPDKDDPDIYKSGTLQLRLGNSFVVEGSFDAGDHTQFNISNNNPQVYNNLGIATRIVDSEFEFDPTVIWLSDSTSRIEGLTCTATGVGTAYFNKCVKQVGRRCHFANPWLDTDGDDKLLTNSHLIQDVRNFADPQPVKSEDLDVFYSDVWSGNFTEGTEVKWVEQPLQYYIANGLESDSVVSVYAKRKVNRTATEEFVPVPSSYYTVNLANNLVSGQTITTVTFDFPLESRGEGWSSDIYVSLKSSQPVQHDGKRGNSARTIQYLIDTYAVDKTSNSTQFDSVAELVKNYPANFMLRQNKPINGILDEIAFQSRCAIRYFSNDIGIKYIGTKNGTPFTLDKDKIEAESILVKMSNFNDLKTRISASWKQDGSGIDDPKNIEIENNIDIYGTAERQIDFYIYNIESLVNKSSQFWLNRMSRIWRQTKLSCFLYGTAVEPFDLINVDVSGLNDEIYSPLIDSNDSSILSVSQSETQIDIDIEHPTNDSGDHLPALYWGDDAGDTYPPDPTDGLSQIDYYVDTGTDHITDDDKQGFINHKIERHSNVKSGATNGDILQFNGSTKKYEPVPAGDIGGVNEHDLDFHSDTTIVDPIVGEHLIFDQGTALESDRRSASATGTGWTDRSLTHDANDATFGYHEFTVPATSDELQQLNFGFGFSDQDLSVVEITIRQAATGTSVIYEDTVQLVYNGSPIGINGADADHQVSATSEDRVFTLGDGVLTSAIVKDSTFGLKIKYRQDSGFSGDSVQVFFVKMSVYPAGQWRNKESSNGNTGTYVNYYVHGIS